MTSKIYVHTIGNSIIDNLPFLLHEGSSIEQAKKDSVEGQLQTQLNELDSTEKNYEVVSQAYAGFPPYSVLKGGTIGEKLLQGQARDAYMREKVIDTDFVKPLETLQTRISENPQAKHFVVIGFSLKTERYLEIADRVQKMGGKPILIISNLDHANHYIYTIRGVAGTILALVSVVCLAYLARFAMHVVLHKVSLYSRSTIFATLAILNIFSQLSITLLIAKSQHPGMALTKVAVQRLSIPILEYAKKDKLPIIDLPNTIDPNQTELYSYSIESSKQGGALIAKAICQAIKNEDPDDSYIYTDKGFSINYPREWEIKI